MLILIIVAILGFYIFLCMKKNKEDNIPIEDKISQMLIIGYSDNPEIRHGILDDIANNKRIIERFANQYNIKNIN